MNIKLQTYNDNFIMVFSMFERPKVVIVGIQLMLLKMFISWISIRKPLMIKMIALKIALPTSETSIFAQQLIKDHMSVAKKTEK